MFPSKPSTGDTFSILQFNCLADALSDAFPHVSSQHILTWEYRCPLFEWLFKGLDVDILCLEEVDHFDDFFKPFLATLGYDGIFEQRRHEPNPISKDGVALFWKKDKFHLIDKLPVSSSEKTFGIWAFLQEKTTQFKIAVGVVHLTAKPGREQVRMNEIGIFIETLLEKASAPIPVVIAGDFNDVPGSLVFKHMQACHFNSVYEHNDSSWTTWKKRETEVKRVIDYIWYLTPRECEMKLIESLPEPYDYDFPSMLPDVNFPSDHICIGATFRCQSSFPSLHSSSSSSFFSLPDIDNLSIEKS